MNFMGCFAIFIFSTTKASLLGYSKVVNDSCFNGTLIATLGVALFGDYIIEEEAEDLVFFSYLMKNST